MEWLNKTIGDMIDLCAENYGDSVALFGEDFNITYQELSERVEALESALIQTGIKRNDNVAVLLPNCPEWVYIWFACSKIGARSVPINTRYLEEEIAYVLKESDSVCLFFIDEFINIDFTKILAKLIPELGSDQHGSLKSETFPHLRMMYSVGKSHAGIPSFNDLLNAARKDILPSEVPTSTDINLIQYTSGTTAFPKGAMLTHGSMLQSGFCIGERWQVTPEDRFCCVLPFYHCGGTIFFGLNAMTHGASLYLMPYWDPSHALKAIEKYRLTIFGGAETHIIDVLNQEAYTRQVIESLRLVPLASPSLEMIRRTYERLGFETTNHYGLTEGSCISAIGDLNDPIELRLQWAGLPMPGIEIGIFDPNTGEELPPGTEGEIWVRGWGLMKGYYNKKVETAKALDEFGWLHTGDLGVKNEAGYMRFTGRIKDMIKPGGENVSAAEVEAVINRHPDVIQTAIVGVPDERMGEVPMAFIQATKDSKCTEEEIISFCKDKMAKFKIPKYVRFVDKFPTTGSNKIQKFVLRNMVIKDFD